MTKTLLRKKLKTIKDVPPATLLAILYDYQLGIYTWDDLEGIHKIKRRSIEDWVNSQIAQLNIIKETATLDPTKTQHFTCYKPTNLINEPFLDLLSPDVKDIELTENEFSYIYLLVFTGDNGQALIESGLDAGLPKHNVKNTAAYAHALKMRGLFLRQKSNIKVRLQELRAQKYKELGREVNKDFVVSELIEQLDRLKESGSKPKLITDVIDKIGKTCGAFVERIEVSEITASSKMDQLISMAKEEVILQLPTDFDKTPQLGPTEVWEAEAD